MCLNATGAMNKAHTRGRAFIRLTACGSNFTFPVAPDDLAPVIVLFLLFEDWKQCTRHGSLHPL